jgi:hypothetical protein
MTKTSTQLRREIAQHIARGVRPRKPVQRTIERPKHPPLSYRSIGKRGHFSTWLRELANGQSGAYVIRDATTHRVLYVGSSSRKLYDTIARHVQAWTRQKTFWSASYAQGGKRHDPGTTYDRAHIEVAVVLTGPAPASLHMERTLIHRLKPRDNLARNPDGELDAAPF